MWLDGLASVVIGLILGGTAIWLAIETQSLLIGEAAEPEVVDGVREIAAREASVVAVREVLTLHMGPDYILVNLSVDFADEGSARDLERAVARMDESIRAAFPRVKRVFIEAEGSAAAASQVSNP
jgi:divalent metal cation (Fe/Co/Zn/Cd) transporter